MSDASTISSVPAAAPSSGIVRLIAPGLLSASAVYVAATTMLLPRIQSASAAIDVFVAAVLPGLVVIMLLWAARPAAFPQRRRRALVTLILLGAAAAAILPMLSAGA
jgi:hypothetical protein